MGAERASDGPTRIGPYRLLHRLGEGGMGVVHMGLDSTGRAVAIKVLRAHIAHDPDARARLKREVSTLARVRHPLVAEVLDADVDGERPYVVTRYVPGPGLDDVVARNGPLPVDELTRVGRGLSDALGAIHAAGVVHRDLKPGNVLMLDGEPVVIDFGIAHVADDVRLTSVGLVMGTPGYLSPEVIDGEPVSTATDWWGWAATLSFAASGRPPFGRGPMDVVIDRVRRGQCDLEGVDPRLQPLLLSALDVDPARRPVAGEVLAELDRYAAHSGSTVVLPQGASATQRLSSGTQLLPAGGVSATRVLPGAVASGSTAGHVSTHAPGAGRAATRAAAPDSAPAAARNQAPATAPTHALAPELVAATGTPPSPWWVPKAQAARSANGVAHAAAPDDLWRQPAQPGAGRWLGRNGLWRNAKWRNASWRNASCGSALRRSA
jgi:serine/threonine protein kinase